MSDTNTDPPPPSPQSSWLQDALGFFGVPAAAPDASPAPPAPPPPDATTASPAAPAPSDGTPSPAGWTFDPIDPSKKPPVNLNLPPDYVPPPTAPADPPPPPPPPDSGVDADAKASVTADPAGKSVETQIEIELSYAESSGIRRTIPVKLTVHLGPNGFDGLEGELATFSKNLASQVMWGGISDVSVSVSIDAQVSLDRDTANRVLPSFSAKLKAALSGSLGIPGTSIKIPIEVSIFVDPQGRPGAGVSVTVFEF